jgi:hypothetical protein
VRLVRDAKLGARFGERLVNAGGSAVDDHQVGAISAE